MRQVGVLAACAIVGLTRMVERLSEDHVKARTLAEKLAELEEVDIDLETVQTNIVYFSFRGGEIDPRQFAQLCSQKGVKIGVAPDGRIRLVTHHDVTMEGVSEAAEVLRSIAGL